VPKCPSLSVCYVCTYVMYILYIHLLPTIPGLSVMVQVKPLNYVCRFLSFLPMLDYSKFSFASSSPYSSPLSIHAPSEQVSMHEPGPKSTASHPTQGNALPHILPIHTFSLTLYLKRDLLEIDLSTPQTTNTTACTAITAPLISFSRLTSSPQSISITIYLASLE